MPLQPQTLAFLRFLHNNPEIRRQIRAGRDRTLLYAGWNPNTIGGSLGYQKYEIKIYHEILAREIKHPELRQKEILTEVLKRVLTPGSAFANLLDYANDVERQVKGKSEGDDKDKDATVLWRALSGIFASNASGAVSFYLGTRVDAAGKYVFTTTEIAVLRRNTALDQTTKDFLEYYDRCLKNGEELAANLIHGA